MVMIIVNIKTYCTFNECMNYSNHNKIMNKKNIVIKCQYSRKHIRSICNTHFKQTKLNKLY